MRYLFGIQPTGRIHIGNYLGGLKLAIEKGATIMIANLHAMTSPGTGRNILSMATELEIIGVEDICIQDNESPFLAWKIQCLTPMSDLKRMTQFKDKGEGNVGLFTYPCLMAADIVLSCADVVIVGEDQLQHMEFYRRTCRRLGIKKIAKTLLTETPRIMSIKDPAKKMSKSLGDDHCLYIGDHEANRKKIMRAPTTLEGMKNLEIIAKGLGVKFYGANMKETKELIIKGLEDVERTIKGNV